MCYRCLFWLGLGIVGAVLVAALPVLPGLLAAALGYIALCIMVAVAIGVTFEFLGRVWRWLRAAP